MLNLHKIQMSIHRWVKFQNMNRKLVNQQRMQLTIKIQKIFKKIGKN